MKKLILIHKHGEKKGGIGDFIRASISLYSLSKKMDFDYYIDLTDNNYLDNCFEYKKLELSNEEKDNIETLDMIGGITSPEYMINLINNLLNQPQIYYIYCNLVGFEKTNDYKQHIDEYNDYVLKPSLSVLNKIKDLFTFNNLEENNYISVHVRCGDYTMNLQGTSDFRVNIFDEYMYIDLNNKIQKFITNQNIMDKKIVLNTDSIYFKNQMKEKFNQYIYPDIEIKHIAEDAGSNTQDAYISTIAEFYFISKAYIIFLPLSYSGFPHWSAVLGKKNLVSLFNNEHLSCVE